MSSTSNASGRDQTFKLDIKTGRSGDQDVKVGVFTFDLASEKVNKLSKHVLGQFELWLPELASANIDVLILRSGKIGNFVAGADIELIRATKTSEEAKALAAQGQSILNRWEDLPYPTVAAIDGAALGGGCEWSLSCTAIVMSQSQAARIGLPEVNLGVIPGMGGCVRLPRKVGLATALDMILTGKFLSGDRAYKSGLADGVLPAENFDASVFAWVLREFPKLKSGTRIAKEPALAGMGGLLGKTMEFTPMGRSVMLGKAKEGVLGKTRGKYPSPLEAIEVLGDIGACYGEKWKGSKRDEALDREAAGFGKCAATPISKNLISLFFLTESVKKSKGVDSAALKDLDLTAHSVGVLGAGVMGGGIAQLLADKKIHARMKDISLAGLTTGVTSAVKIFKGQLKKRKINERQMLQKLNYIAPTVDFSGFGSTQVVIEAVIEKMDIKKKVFAELEGHVGPDCVIASNTSSLSISEMQTALKNPARFAGMHFFNPVHRMPLVEVIRGKQSDDRAVSAIYQLAKQLGKTPIVVKDAPGFLVNRLLMPYLNEATWLLTSGVCIPELDEALLEFGMPMGPMELIDEVGVDTGEKVAHILHDGFGARFEPSPLNSKLVGAERLGKKNKKGFYTYDDTGRNKQVDEEIYKILGTEPKAGAMSAEDMVDRCILPMINEAARCLDDEVVRTPQEVDLGMIMGTGFPPFRGGLLKYADSRGVREIVERLKQFQNGGGGARYEPSSSLLKRVETGFGA